MAGTFFIVGSGFTHAATGGDAPLNRDLLRLARPSAPILGELANHYNTEDIEIALTRLDLDLIAKPHETELVDFRRQAEKELSSFFAQFRFNEDILQEIPWLNDFIRGAFRKGDVAVSLNYDCLLEGVLDYCGLWSPSDGYTKTQALLTVPTDDAPSPVTVLKIHGSENFRRDDAIGSRTTKAVSFTVNQSIFPNSGRSRHFCEQRKNSLRAIIPPSFVKVFPAALVCLMFEALENAVAAQTLVLIGCGLRPEDTFLYLVLWHFLGKDKRIIILDPCASSLSQRISSTLEYDLSSIICLVDESLEGGWSDLISELAKTEGQVCKTDR